jgi:hypothetical protein
MFDALRHPHEHFLSMEGSLIACLQWSMVSVFEEACTKSPDDLKSQAYKSITPPLVPSSRAGMERNLTHHLCEHSRRYANPQSII